MMNKVKEELQSNNVLLKVENLKTYFFTRHGVVKAVDGISFSLKGGESLGLVGESGCGKSVTSLSIMRLVAQPAGRIVSGQIVFEGEDLLQKTEKEMQKIRGRKISMVLQDPEAALNPVLTIGSQVKEPIRIHQGLRGKTLVERAIETLRLLRIPDPGTCLRLFPLHLSGGMKQRVVGAMALACQPSLLIADEPTTSLDTTVQVQYLAVLKDLQRRLKTALLFITHDLGIVANMCDLVAVMYAGKIVETGNVEAIFENNKHPYTVGLLNSIPRLGSRYSILPSIDGQPPSLLNPPSGCRFHPRCTRRMDICSKEEPKLIPVDKSHYVSCWLWAA